MARGLVAAMAQAWSDPRGAMARQVAGGLSETRALQHLTLACGLGFVASAPAAVRRAQALQDVPDALTGVIAAHLFGYVFVAPLLLYAVAALLHLAARAFGGRGGFLGARAALFWAALLGAPIDPAVIDSARAVWEAAAWRSLPCLGA